MKRKNLESVEKDQPASVKVPKLGASSSSPSTQVRNPERAQSPPVEAPTVLSSQPRSRSAAKAKGPLGGAVEQLLVVMPITVWNPPTKSVRSPSRMAEELRRKDPKSEIGGDRDSLLLNVELAASAVSSILKDSEQAELWGQVQRMTEEAVKLKSDLKHTTSARARAEGREDEAQHSLRAAEGELREVRDDLRAAQNDLLEARDGL